MAEIDRSTVDHLAIPAQQLMEQAAHSIWSQFQKRFHFSEEDKKRLNLFFACGTGNNGGDGYVLARLAKQSGFLNIEVVKIGDPKTAPSILNYQKVKQLGLKIIPYSQENDLKQIQSSIKKADFLFDALLGTGSTPPLRGGYVPLSTSWNQSKAFKVAVDIPSGLGEGFQASMAFFLADWVLTVEVAKIFLYYPLQRGQWKELSCCQAGFPDEAFSHQLKQRAPRLLFSHTLKGTFIVPDGRVVHKNKRGRVALFAGSKEYPGAGILAAKAVLKSGAGYLHLLSDGKVVDSVLAHSPSVVATALSPQTKQKRGWLSSTEIQQIKRCDVIAAGSGWGSSPGLKELLAKLLAIHSPLILDADAITLLSAHCDLEQWVIAHPNLIMTPHPGEFCRLAGITINKLEANPLLYLRDYCSRLQVTILLKGAVNWLVSPCGEILVFDSSRAHLAVAGSGDLLTGILAALGAQALSLAQENKSDNFSFSWVDCLKKAVVVHAIASDLAFYHMGWVTPDEIANELGKVVAHFMGFCVEESTLIERMIQASVEETHG